MSKKKSDEMGMLLLDASTRLDGVPLPFKIDISDV